MTAAERTYRAVVKQLFALHADRTPPLAAVARALERVTKGEEMIGPSGALAILAQEATAHRMTTGRCPWCLTEKSCQHLGASAMVGATPTHEERTA